MTILRTIGYSLLCLSAAACSANAGDPANAGDELSAVGEGAPASNEPVASGSEQLLNRFTFQDLQLSFYWMGPDSIESQQGQIGIEEHFRSVDYLSTLREEYGALTALEIFEAFAPAGMEPHPALIAQQEAEARAYGRADDDLEARDIDGHALSIEKSLPANCTSAVLPNISPLHYFVQSHVDVGIDGVLRFLCADSNAKNGSVSSPTSNLGCQLQTGSNLLTVGICNDTASINSTEFWTQTNDFRGSLFTTKRTSIAPGQVGRFDALPSAPPFDGPSVKSLGVIGRNSTANAVNFHQQLMGSGS
jgi:hypothetical protein